MQKDPEKILYILKKLRLPAEEKSAMRFMLVSHIETQEKIRRLSRELATRRESPFQSFVFGKRMLAGTVALLLIGSTGVTLAAEDTLPGDLLYGVKIHVTEEFRGALTVGSTAKVKWEKDRVVKRVVETEKLIKEKKLTPARKAQAEAAIKEQIQKFDTVATSEKENPVGVIEATSDLEPTLKAHQEVLASLAIDTPSPETNDIIKTVEVGIQVSGAQESTALDSIDTITQDELSTAVDDKITDTEKAIETLSQTDVASDANDATAIQNGKDAVGGGTDNDSVESIEGASLDVPMNIPSPTGTATTSGTENTMSMNAQDVATVTPSDSGIAFSATAKTMSIPSSAATVTDTDTATKIATEAKIKSDNRKEVLAQAKAMLITAREKKANGELSEALRLAQQAYKSVLELNVGTQLSKDATEKETMNDASDGAVQKIGDNSSEKEIDTTQKASVVDGASPLTGVTGAINPATAQAQTILPIQ